MERLTRFGSIARVRWVWYNSIVGEGLDAPSRRGPAISSMWETCPTQQRGETMDRDMQDILRQVREAAAKHVLFLPHALSQMNTPERMISTEEVRAVIFRGQIIEDYPEDSRGHSCLMLGQGVNSRPVHVVCAPKSDYLAIITAYLPSLNQWKLDWQTRREK